MIISLSRINLKYILSVLYFLITTFSMQAQPKPCSDPAFSQFDFWLGEWDLTYNDTARGTNSIKRVNDGCTIEENFNDNGQGFRGQSWSVYNPLTKQWQQTWVDNQGGYIVLTGEFKDDKMVLTTQPIKNKDSVDVISRMIFYNIEENSLDWSWEKSEDGGKSWKVSWKIHYERRK